MHLRALLLPPLLWGPIARRWAQGHPDRKGKTLQRLVPVLKAIVADCDRRIYGFPPTWGIVWDFMALPQRGYTTGYDPAQDDRTPEQLALFGKGIRTINEVSRRPPN